MKMTKRAARLIYNAYIDCLGIAKYPKLKLYEDPKDDHCGYYSKDDDLIAINLSNNFSVKELSDTIGHELSHYFTRMEAAVHGQKWKDKAKDLGVDPYASRRKPSPNQGSRLK